MTEPARESEPEPTPIRAELPRPTDAPPLDVRLERLVSQRDGKPLVRERTLLWIPWFIILIGLGLIGSLEAARYQAGTPLLTWEIRGTFIILLIAAAFGWHLYHARVSHNRKFIFSKPDEAFAFVWLTDGFIAFGTPKVWQQQYAWLYFNKYLIGDHELRLIAGGYTLRIDLTHATDEQRAQLRAGLARAFSRPRFGPKLFLRHCLGCGYDLSASPGPDCPECGRPLHKHNYPDARIGS